MSYMTDSLRGYDKKWPINIKQLMTERLDCKYCKTMHEDKPVGNTLKCKCCGIATQDFIEGTLIGLFKKKNKSPHSRKYPVVLIENVMCPNIVRSEEYKKFLNESVIESDHFLKLFEDDNYYVRRKSLEVDPETYYLFDMSYIYGNDDGICIAYRNKCPNYKAECVQTDINFASELMQTLNTGKKLDPHCYTECSVKIDGKPDEEIIYYEYLCPRTGLSELAFPITIQTRTVAVLIVGQILTEKTAKEGIKTLCEKANNTILLQPIKESKEAAKDMVNDIYEFIDRMNRRAQIRISDYLYTLLEQLMKFVNDEKNKKLPVDTEDIIKKIYDRIFEDFAVKTLHIFLSEQSEQKNEYECKSILGYKNRNKDESVTAYINVDKSFISAISEESQKEEIIKYIYYKDGKNKIPLSPDNKNDIYYITANITQQTYFILVYIEWERDNNEVINTFFNTLNTSFFSILMTDIAKNKQEGQEVFIETFAHELNQKIEILDSHTQSVKESSMNYKFSEDSYNTLFYRTNDYLKDVTNLYRSLRYFVDAIKESNLKMPQNIKYEEFYPYSRFLFNLREYYTNNYYDKNLNMFPPHLIAQHSNSYPLMRADPTLIERCVNNLLANAFKYSFAYSNIYLDCYYEKENKNYVTTVTNYGKPIPENMHEKIFEWGVGKGQNYRRPRGFGFGLSIARHLAILHGGTLEFEKFENNGIISNYNISILYELLTQKFRDEKKLKNICDFEKKYNLNYDELMREYKRLESILVNNKDSTTVKYFANTTIDEIVYKNEKLKTYLTPNFIKNALYTPTARIRFKLTIPQSNYIATKGE